MTSSTDRMDCPGCGGSATAVLAACDKKMQWHCSACGIVFPDVPADADTIDLASLAADLDREDIDSVATSIVNMATSIVNTVATEVDEGHVDPDEVRESVLAASERAGWKRCRHCSEAVPEDELVVDDAGPHVIYLHRKCLTPFLERVREMRGTPGGPEMLPSVPAAARVIPPPASGLPASPYALPPPQQHSAGAHPTGIVFGRQNPASLLPGAPAFYPRRHAEFLFEFWAAAAGVRAGTNFSPHRRAPQKRDHFAVGWGKFPSDDGPYGLRWIHSGGSVAPTLQTDTGTILTIYDAFVTVDPPEGDPESTELWERACMGLIGSILEVPVPPAMPTRIPMTALLRYRPSAFPQSAPLPDTRGFSIHIGPSSHHALKLDPVRRSDDIGDLLHGDWGYYAVCAVRCSLHLHAWSDVMLPLDPSRGPAQP